MVLYTPVWPCCSMLSFPLNKADLEVSNLFVGSLYVNWLRMRSTPANTHRRATGVVSICPFFLLMHALNKGLGFPLAVENLNSEDFS